MRVSLRTMSARMKGLRTAGGPIRRGRAVCVFGGHGLQWRVESGRCGRTGAVKEEKR